MIRSAKSPPFLIQEMEGKFIDFTLVETQIHKHPDLKISECRWIQFSKDSLAEIRTRLCHNTIEPWKGFTILKRKKGRQTTDESRLYRKVEFSTFPKLYPQGLPIKTAKKGDLLKLAEYLPAGPAQFYRSLAAA